MVHFYISQDYFHAYSHQTVEGVMAAIPKIRVNLFSIHIFEIKHILALLSSSPPPKKKCFFRHTKNKSLEPAERHVLVLVKQIIVIKV